MAEELNLPAIFAALATAIVTACPEVNAYDHMPDRPTGPAWFPGPVDIETNNTMRGMDIAVIQSFLVVDRTGDPRADQHCLANYLRRKSAVEYGSVVEAIRGTRASRLSGLVGGINIQSIQGWREYLFGECRSYGARIDIKVTGV